MPFLRHGRAYLTVTNVRTIFSPMVRHTKGEQTRAAILDQAVELASRVGLEGLTIGSLAEATGMSKSGLFAHFGSREDLQLATLEHVKTSFGEQVLAPVLKMDRGLPRLRALFQSWLDWKASPGPGGCVLQSAAHALHSGRTATASTS